MDVKNVTHFDSPGAFRAWLRKHHGAQEELWVGYWKKATGRRSITWEESVDEALCFGWIDGIRKSLDDEAYAIRFTPRRSGSTWSPRNIERYTALAKAGRVKAAGRAAFENRTKEKSRTYAAEQDTPRTLPRNYLARLKSDEDAWADWRSRPPAYRKQAVHWIMSAKRESTRERRLEALIEDCAVGRKVKPLRL